jgi:hypothetical protein
MKRDMELTRKILFEIEEQYEPGEGTLMGLNIDGYDMRTVAEHCDLLFPQGFIKSYKAVYGGDTIHFFQVGNISSSGYDYLELIRNDKVWDKTKAEIEKRQLPQTFDAIAKIAGKFVGNVISQLNG